MVQFVINAVVLSSLKIRVVIRGQWEDRYANVQGLILSDHRLEFTNIYSGKRSDNSELEISLHVFRLYLITITKGNLRFLERQEHDAFGS